MVLVVFEDIDADKHRDEIIVQTVNHGNLAHWRWIIECYGKETIRAVLERRLATEFYPEFRNLAQVVFSVNHFRDARGSAY